MNDCLRSYDDFSYDDEEFDEFEGMTDEEIDELYRPKKSNSRKSLAPLFVYLILKDHSDDGRHMSHKDILKELEEYPYEVHIERKALGRIIHNLTDSQLNIYSGKRSGTWYSNRAA
ncbi:MAG: hypothetical protein Q4E57_05800 [Eubacteriales bacterium]|nr:hypothetical protein [Eubacteriales bacterium]